MESLQEELSELKKKLAEKDALIEVLKERLKVYETEKEITATKLPLANDKVDIVEEKLTNDEVARFSRQIILPDFRVKGQQKLKKSRVLVVGCGGLGCPSAVFLAGAGVGTIGLVDFDTVDISNLHRQIMHSTTRVGELKCVSLAKSLHALNPNLQYLPIHTSLNSDNALEIIKSFDIVLDCTDNVATRYLLNDACVIAGKPLVSGSALRWEGQLTVYNFQDGPTYRCLYPTPPPPSAVTNCSDGGVVGAIPGVIGVLQALETIKMIVHGSSSLSGKLLLFDGTESRFRTVKLRSRTTEGASITKLIDYVQFCGSGAHDKDEGIQILTRDQRISAKELHDKIENGGDKEKYFVLVDVRLDTEFEIGSIPGSKNIPIDTFQTPESIDKHMTDHLAATNPSNVVFICRRGNDSQRASVALREYCDGKGLKVDVKDVVGGLHAWARHVDKDFPVY
eukprot:TRINITY_DN3880_c0_g1_i4.p1 TRINITY_DN3880_c0_g1~~TRINITY_DN3880_c0_g1_i4.p1  ORF type:complete len:466 (-),score=72.43 TRINITY_DN3880_c0_g1_i4:261-1616(-)